MVEQPAPEAAAEPQSGAMEVHRNAWRRTLDEMTALADELAADGWDVVTVPAGSTGPEAPIHGDDDRFGLTYVIPGNKVEPFREAYEKGSFEEYHVYQNDVTGRGFVVTVVLDSPSETAIVLAGNYDRSDAYGLVKAAVETDEMYSHVRKLDGTYLGTFEHADYSHFFPNSDEVLERFEPRQSDGE